MSARRRPPYPWIALVIASVLAAEACADRAARGEPTALTFARADVIAAQRGAPDLLACAERARAEAIAESDRVLQTEHMQRARTWLAAAVAEARRIDAARAASKAEGRIAAAEACRLQLERERAQLREGAQRAQAASAAQAAFAHAFEVLERDAREGGRSAQLDSERNAAADALEAQARLSWAAASALGLSAERVTELRARDEELEARWHAAVRRRERRMRDASERLHGAQLRWRVAQSALSEARALAPGPAADEREALLELARVLKLEPQVSERGVVFGLERAFVGADWHLNDVGRGLVLAIGDLIRAHPHGPVQLQVLPAEGASVEQQRAGKDRGTYLTTLLRGATKGERLEVTAMAPPGNLPAIVLPAYASVLGSTPAASKPPASIAVPGEP